MTTVRQQFSSNVPPGHNEALNVPPGHGEASNVPPGHNESLNVPPGHNELAMTIHAPSHNYNLLETKSCHTYVKAGTHTVTSRERTH